MIEVKVEDFSDQMNADSFGLTRFSPTSGGDLTFLVMHGAGQAQYVLNNHVASPSRGVVSFSMAGQAALELCLEPANKISSAVLFSPAVYADAARSVTFGPDFSRVIRTVDSWRSSRIFSSLNSYQGELLTLWGSEDTVVPREVVTRIYECCTEVSRKEDIILQGAPHTLSGWFQKDDIAADKIMSIVTAFLDAGQAR
jgi:dienelactone hydrolase